MFSSILLDFKFLTDCPLAAISPYSVSIFNISFMPLSSSSFCLFNAYSSIIGLIYIRKDLNRSLGLLMLIR